MIPDPDIDTILERTRQSVARMQEMTARTRERLEKTDTQEREAVEDPAPATGDAKRSPGQA